MRYLLNTTKYIIENFYRLGGNLPPSPPPVRTYWVLQTPDDNNPIDREVIGTVYRDTIWKDFEHWDDNKYWFDTWNLEVALPQYHTYTVIINQDDSDPETACTYADDAIGMTPGSSEWDEIFGEYPVMLKSGVEGKRINQNDFSKYEDGSTIPADGTDGDWMIKFPYRKYKISTVGSSNAIKIQISDNPNFLSSEIAFKDYSGNTKDCFYVAAFIGSQTNYNSLPYQYPNFHILPNDIFTRCENNGEGYSVLGFQQYTYLQVLYLLKYKNRKSVNFAYGAINNPYMITTGETLRYGMNMENVSESIRKDKTKPMKMFGIEDLWGNYRQLLKGVYVDTSKNLIMKYTQYGETVVSTNYIKKGTLRFILARTNNILGGFLPSSVMNYSDSYTYNYCGEITIDDASVLGKLLITYSMYLTSNNESGIFAFYGSPETNAEDSVSARLMYI